MGLAALLLIAGHQGAAAAERILDFHSEVTVQPDASLIVIETIKVRAESRQIKRGIVREFPTSYRNRLGSTVEVGFSLRQVKLNGKTEPYHIKSASNGVRIYIGQKNKYLRPGIYTYQITYWTDHQVGFFSDYDELYWNVTGNGWTFPIDRARATVKLPPGAKVLQQAAYTGPAGAKGQDFAYQLDQQGRPQWVTTRPFRPREGLTIAVAWPKGLVTEPTFSQEAARYFLRHNTSVAGLAGLAALLLYYLFAWVRVGRDPRSGTIIPLFEPPEGLSPAAARYLMEMGYDNQAFTAAVVNMAVKGYLTIEQGADGKYTLHRTTESPDKLSPGESRLGPALFGGRRSINLKKSNHSRISKAIQALRKTLQKEYEKANFKTNLIYILPGVIITFLTLAAMVLLSREPTAAFGISAWLLLWSIGCYVLSVWVVRAWGMVKKSGGKTAAIAITLFALPFFLGAVFGLYIFGQFTSTASVLIFLVLLALTPIFQHLLKAPTAGGRRLMDQIEGFKMYLSVAEKERLEVLHPPDKTPELFERYLPYALALGVEHQWSEQFADVLEQAGAEPYQPRWYSGRSFSTEGPSGLADGLSSSLGGAISSSSTAPGSSSGSGGGGSSGGGGGGGGGSGW
jgi:uncharacterized membrane protein YgcG